MIRVLIADDQALIRAGFAVLVASAADMQVVAEASDGGQAYARACEHRPDVVLMDIRMPGTDGLSACALITRDPELTDVRVLVLTTFEADEYVLSALRAGRAASSARVWSRPNSSMPSASWRPAMPCSRPRRRRA
jgi:DNA-binding NarL/FixJ family response regulator